MSAPNTAVMPRISIPLGVLFALLLLAIWVAALLWSIFATTPAPLPDVALGAPALLHVIRAVVATALIGGSAFVLMKGAAGQWPTEIGTSGVKWAEDLTEVEQNVVDLLRVTKDQQQRLEELERRLGV